LIRAGYHTGREREREAAIGKRPAAAWDHSCPIIDLSKVSLAY